MLILRRRKNESILIGNDIRITIIECAADGVRLAIDAPKQVSIIREELSEAEQINKHAMSPNATSNTFSRTGIRNHHKNRHPAAGFTPRDACFLSKHSKQQPYIPPDPAKRKQEGYFLQDRVDSAHIFIFRKYPGKPACKALPAFFCLLSYPFQFLSMPFPVLLLLD